MRTSSKDKENHNSELNSDDDDSTRRNSAGASSTPPSQTRGRLRPRPPNNVIRYGQIVVGGPGTGKTTYCDGMQQYLRAIGRSCVVVNMDPANEVTTKKNDGNDNANDDGEYYQDNKKEQHDDADDNIKDGANQSSSLPYDTILDVCEDVIHLSSVMEEYGLGPNGGLLYCMEYIEHHKQDIVDMLLERLELLEEEGKQPVYVIFDFPGQIELYTHNDCVQKLCEYLTQQQNGFRLTCIQLTDSLQCFDSSKFISSVLLSATSMLRLELPTINVLSKIDLMGQYTNQNSLIYGIDFFTNVLDLSQLLEFLDGGKTSLPAMDANGDDDYFADDPEYQRVLNKRRQQSRFYLKHRKLHEQICEVIEDFNLVSFLPLNIMDASSVGRILAQADKCNGCAFLSDPQSDANIALNGNIFSSTPRDLFHSAVTQNDYWNFEQMAQIHERYIEQNQFQDPATLPSSSLPRE